MRFVVVLLVSVLCAWTQASAQIGADSLPHLLQARVEDKKMVGAILGYDRAGAEPVVITVGGTFDEQTREDRGSADRVRA